jgi:hypothetical protein
VWRCRFDFQDAPLGVIGEQINGLIRSLLYLADAFTKVAEIPHFPRDPTAFQIQAHERARIQRADKKIACPARESIARVK